jgi:hypothetical protein
VISGVGINGERGSALERKVSINWSKVLLSVFVPIFAFVIALSLLPGMARASGKPASTETLIAGSYIIDVNLYQDPPVADQASEITVVPHETNVRLSGRVIMMPGLGTDAVELHSNLVSLNQTNTLIGMIRMPVRGAWQIIIQLNGPQGAGEASFPVRVAGPGAMPFWMAWLIALAPLIGITWWIWHQRRYRKKLLIQISEQT